MVHTDKVLLLPICSTIYSFDYENKIYHGKILNGKILLKEGIK